MTRINFEIARSYIAATAITAFTTAMLAVMAIAPAAGTYSNVGIV